MQPNFQPVLPRTLRFFQATIFIATCFTFASFFSFFGQEKIAFSDEIQGARLAANLLPNPNAIVAVSERSPTSVIRLGLAPDNTLELATTEINRAKEEILVNFYTLEQPAIMTSIIAAIDRGVTVKLLIEGEPLGGATVGEINLIKLFRQRLNKTPTTPSRLFVMSNFKNTEAKRRYPYDHAKYLVIDHSRVVLGSENYGLGGHPIAGLVGNRGWEVAITNETLAAELTALFNIDSDTTLGDVTWVSRGVVLPVRVEKPKEPAEEETEPTPPKKRTLTPVKILDTTVDGVKLITSPHSFESTAAWIRQSTKTLNTEQMSLPISWREKSGAPSYRSLWMQEIINAARKGVQVRVLLNDDKAFLPKEPDPETNHDTLTVIPYSKFPNQEAVRFLNSFQTCYQLPIAAKIINLSAIQANYIHNKGWISDDSRVLVSSINGSRNSIYANRETALALEGADATQYYQGAFDFDWNSSNQPAQGRDPAVPCSSLEETSRTLFTSFQLFGFAI